MSVYFCEQTGVRIAAPGVCKAVDPVNGQDECSEPAEADTHETKPAKAGSHSSSTRSTARGD